MLGDNEMDAEGGEEESLSACPEDIEYARSLLAHVTAVLARSGVAHPVGIPQVSLELSDAARRVLHRARLELLCFPLPPAILGDALAAAAISHHPTPLHARPPPPHSAAELAARGEGGEGQGVALVAGWLAAHHPVEAVRHALLRRASAALRECGSTSLPPREAMCAAHPALWLLDGLWRSTSALAAAGECTNLIEGGRFEFGSPLLLPELSFAKERERDGTALAIALAACAPLTERLRVQNSKASLQVRGGTPPCIPLAGRSGVPRVSCEWRCRPSHI